MKKLNKHYKTKNLDVVLMISKCMFVSHKCCNYASKIHFLSFDKYSCFLLSRLDSVPFPRTPVQY